MKITPQAQDVLNQVLKENEADGLIALVHQTCCSSSPGFQMARFDESDQPEVIDGISIVFEPGAKEAVSDVIIDVENGELVVLNPVCSCGSDCGHDHDHDHDGGCCGNHSGGGCCSH